MLWQSALSVAVVAGAGSIWTWFGASEVRAPEIGQSRAQAEKSLGQFAFFGRTCFGELAVFTDRTRKGREEHVMAFLDDAGQKVIASEIQTEEIQVQSLEQCKGMVTDQISSSTALAEYDAGAKQRYFVRAKRKDGTLRELWADYKDDGVYKTCEVFDRTSTPGHNRLTSGGEWILPGGAKTAEFNAFSPSSLTSEPGS